MKKHYLILLAFSGLATSVVAQAPLITNIDINNIDAKISSSSDLFWDFMNAGFEVPKGGGTHAIFTGGMWLGGLDGGNIVHLSAQTYNQVGSDHTYGPIDTVNFVSASSPAWNRSWKLTKQEVLDHQANYTNVNYVVPQNIADWPGYDATLGRVLAPFADYNGNGIYDPENGDYPWILGDETVYSIFNDLVTHTESGCPTVGIEVHRTFWGFDQPSNTALNNSIFSRYEIKNFSNTDYTNVYISLWTDFDLGDFDDDYVGTDIGLDMVYAYNGDAIDGTPPTGYGANPPAIGVYFLNTPLAGSLAYQNANGIPTGNPSSCSDFRNLATSIWLDNQPVTYGGDGRNPGNPVTPFMYPGITNTILYPAFGDWSEGGAGNTPGDRRMIGTIGPISLPAQGYTTFDAGYTWSRANTGGPQASVTQLQADVSSLRVMYNNGQLTALPDHGLALNAEALAVYPNPARNSVTLSNLPDNTDITVTITDLAGKLVFSQSLRTHRTLELNVRDLDRGMYVVEVRNEQFVKQSKLLLQ